MMKQEKSCGALIFRHENGKDEVLIIKQVQGHWCFPKGHVEKGESEIETAKREIREETGLKVKILDGFRKTLIYSPKEGVNKEVVYFAAVVKGGHLKIQEEELSEIHWVTFDEARSLVTYDNDAQMFEKAAAFITENREVLNDPS